MKTKLQTLMFSTLLLSGVMLAPALRAQEAPAPAASERPERPAGGWQRGDRLKMLKEQLALTDAQVEQLKPILAAEREELQALRQSAGENPDRAALREKMQAIREKYRPQIAAVLTEEQKAKLATIQERGPRAGGPGGNGGGAPAARE